MKNPFAGGVAERYHLGRPRHHDRTLRRVGDALPSAGVAIDVAGGTGLSTDALREMGLDAICVDAAVPMLAFARAPKLAAAAERLPFPESVADVVTVSSGVHWFDQDAFFVEARRVLRSTGVLVIYEHGFLGVTDDPSFRSWSREVYAIRYPTPPRGAYPGQRRAAPDDAVLEPAGFSKVGENRFVEQIPFSHDTLVDYFMTQSNTVGPVERGEETIDEVAAWLARETAPFFDGTTERAFDFWGALEWWSPTPS